MPFFEEFKWDLFEKIILRCVNKEGEYVIFEVDRDETSLDLRENELISLSKKIEQLTELADLDLTKNQLTSLPKEIGQLTNLTTLWLWSNQLTSS